jgi:hypothetical protein
LQLGNGTRNDTLPAARAKEAARGGLRLWVAGATPLEALPPSAHGQCIRVGPNPIEWIYTMPLALSSKRGCLSSEWRVSRDCYLQTPKTGSTSVKAALGLPSYPNSALLGRWHNRGGWCERVLLTWRDPVERFISGIATIHHRSCLAAHDKGRPMAPFNASVTGRKNGRNFTSRSEELRRDWCRPLGTLAELETYSGRLLLLLLQNMLPAGRAGKCPEAGLGHATHLLPQALFAALPTVARARERYITTVTALSERAAREAANVTGNGTACGVAELQELNAHEGGAATAEAIATGVAIARARNKSVDEPAWRATWAMEYEQSRTVLDGLTPARLSDRLVQQITRFYADDYALFSHAPPTSVQAPLQAAASSAEGGDALSTGDRVTAAAIPVGPKHDVGKHRLLPTVHRWSQRR